MHLPIKDIINKEGEIVELCGWVDGRRDLGKIIFIDLRDRSGIAQLFFSPSSGDVYKLAGSLRPEWVIRVKGKVNRRPKGMENKNIPAGDFEVLAADLEILSSAKTSPFDISKSGFEISEELRLKYRYLDLRRKRLLKNLKMRHKVIQYARNYLSERGFIEVETPILGKSTPEGARDYLVPSRLEKGKFYALPQSPQQYKQLLMVSGLEKYFQIARCFRDEDTRGDRQPEFTQLDIEMSFPENEEEILKLVEELYIALIKSLAPEKKITQIPFPRLKYEEVMKKYGTDKPDLRDSKNDPNELAFAFITDFPMFEWSKKEKRWDAVHHPFTKIQDTRYKIQDNASRYPEGRSGEGSREEFIQYIKENPDKLLAHQYDFVCNGYEIGGGSLREHRPEVLKAVFEIMGNKPEDIQEQFGHLFSAFEYGVPPHGGIAPGIDRFLMLLLNEPNIREVIAFPKTGDGRDLMMKAPSEVDKKQLEELGIQIKSKIKSRGSK